MEKWKNKKVVWFEWKIYQGFIPQKTGIVIEETDTECLIKIGWNKIWTLKFSEDVSKPVAEKCGYCKLLNI